MLRRLFQTEGELFQIEDDLFQIDDELLENCEICEIPNEL